MLRRSKGLLIGLLVLVSLCLSTVAAHADTFVVLCNITGSAAANRTVQMIGGSTPASYRANSQGCINFDLTTDSPGNRNLHALIQNGWMPLNVSSALKGTVTTAGTQLTTGTAQAQTPVAMVGLTIASGCMCNPQTIPATWQTGVGLTCVAGTDTATCYILNPTAGSITPDAIVLNVRGLP